MFKELGKIALFSGIKQCIGYCCTFTEIKNLAVQFSRTLLGAGHYSYSHIFLKSLIVSSFYYFFALLGLFLPRNPLPLAPCIFYIYYL